MRTQTVWDDSGSTQPHMHQAVVWHLATGPCPADPVGLHCSWAASWAGPVDRAHQVQVVYCRFCMGMLCYFITCGIKTLSTPLYKCEELACIPYDVNES